MAKPVFTSKVIIRSDESTKMNRKRETTLIIIALKRWWRQFSVVRFLPFSAAVILIVLAIGGRNTEASLNSMITVNRGLTTLSTSYQSDLLLAVQVIQNEASKMERSQSAQAHFLALASKIQTTKTLSVIIRLRLPYSIQTEISGGLPAEAQRLAIRQVRERLLDELAGYEPSSVKTYQYLPFVALRLNVVGMSSAQQTVDALDIQEDELYAPMLAQSTQRIGAVQAWSQGYTGAGQTVAIIDSGVDKYHPFLANKVVAEGCYSTNNSDLLISSLCPGGDEESTLPDSGLQCSVQPEACAHGTHVAGIVAGKGSQFAGVARDANLISMQVFSRVRNPAICGSNIQNCIRSTYSDQLKALLRIYELKNLYSIAAVNASIGGGRHYTNCDGDLAPGKDAIDLLRASGVAVVIASGNDGYTDSISAPACISSAISVGSTDTSTDKVSSFSNTSSILHLLAPGNLINSSIPNGQYASMMGTSMAAPHVAGAWALMRQKSPNASVTEIFNAIVNSGVPVSDHRVNITKPRLQIDAALRLLQPPVTPLPPPVDLVAVLRSTGQVELSWRNVATNETGIRVKRRRAEVDSWSVLATLDRGSSSFVDNDIVPGRSYLYTVVAFDARGESASSNQANISVPDVIPSIPTSLRVMAVYPSRIDLSWIRNSTNETGFRIYRRLDSSSAWTLTGTTVNGSTSYSDSGLSRATNYIYRITAFNSVGESLPSNEIAARTPTGDQAFIVVTNTGSDNLDFGQMPVGREPSSALPTELFYLENTTSNPLNVTFRLERVLESELAGKIVNRDDSQYYPIAVLGSNGAVTALPFINGAAVVNIPANQRIYLSISFRPLIPAPAGRIDNLVAGHVLAPEMNSKLTFDDGNGPLASLSLKAKIETKARLINPFVTRLSPLVVLARKGDLIETELTLFDPNLDTYQVIYQFIDRAGRGIGLPVTVTIGQALQTSGMVPGQTFTLFYRFTVKDRINDVNAVRVTVYDSEGNEAATSGDINQYPGRVISVSAASFAQEGVAQNSVGSAFGEGLAPTVQLSGDPRLPTNISGVEVIVRDSANIERAAPLFFVAPGQINYLIPEGVAQGEATVSVIRNDRVVATGPVIIKQTSPGLFTVNSSGQGLAAAQVLAVSSSGQQVYHPIADFDEVSNRFQAHPIEFGQPGDQVYLVLFGTGIRNRSDLRRVSARVAGVDLPVLYAGPQPQYPGVDQVNLRLPRSLAGRGEVDLQINVDGRYSNTVRINIK
jgi:uncharacterized protein (TIGR03437 family)